MVRRRRTKIPEVRLAIAGQYRKAAHLVAGPFADSRAGQIADIVVVKYQQRAELRGAQRLPRSAESITMQASEVDSFLEVDIHHSGCTQRSLPVVTWIDVLRRNRQALRNLGCHIEALHQWT